jgi:hypothetical protein
VVTRLSYLLSILIVMVFCGVVIAQLFSTHKVEEWSHIDTFRRITFVCGSCRRLQR